MDNQHKMIKGYRDLSQEEIDLMNKIKTHAKVLEQLVQEVQEHLSKTCTHNQEKVTVVPEDAGHNWIGVAHAGAQYWIVDDENTRRWKKADPHKWLKRAQEDLQDGFMKLTRAVAQPTTF